MNKIAFIAILSAGLSVEMWGACPYQDCGQYILTHQLMLQQKITSNLNLTYTLIDSVEAAQKEHINTINEQNKVIDTLSSLSAKNNAILREIALEQKKQADLLSMENNLLTKRGEALNMQSGHLSSIVKIKSEE